MALQALEDDVVTGIAKLQLLFDFIFQLVLEVLGFPITVLDGESIEQSAIDDDAPAFGKRDGEFMDELPLELFGAGIKQRAKGLTHGSLMADIELSVLVKGVVVVANLGGRRFEV